MALVSIYGVGDRPGRLLHYSLEPIAEVLDTPQENRKDFKPCGLWVSVEGGDPCWDDWCKGEEFRDHDYYWIYELTLADDANVLVLRTPAEVFEFSQQELFPHRYAEIMDGDNVTLADWGPVAEKYDGLIISPYQHSLRFDHRVSWYYAWDCASGCIWRAGAANLSLVRRPIKTEAEAVRPRTQAEKERPDAEAR